MGEGEPAPAPAATRQCLLGDVGALQASTAERGGLLSPKQTANSVETLHLGRATSSVRERAFPSPILSFLDILPVVEPAGPSAPAFPSSWADACAAPAGRLLGGMRFHDATEPPDGLLRSAEQFAGRRRRKVPGLGSVARLHRRSREANNESGRDLSNRRNEERELNLSFGDCCANQKRQRDFLSAAFSVLPSGRWHQPMPGRSAPAGQTFSGAGLHARLIRACLRARCL